MMQFRRHDNRSTQRERRTFSGGQTTRRNRRMPALPIAGDWRDRVPPALVRVLVGATFIALPAFEIRLGGLALPLLCVILAVMTGIAGVLMGRSEALRSWSLNVTDSATLFLLVPVVAVASGIEVADIRLLAVLAIVAVVAIVTSVESPMATGIALLPATLVIAATIAAAERFAADNLGQGLTAAWMIAAIATLADGAFPPRQRSLVPPVAFALFAIVVAVAGTTDAEVSRSNATIAFLTTAASGAALLLAPVGTLRARLFVTEPLRTRSDQ
jgi:hypothetical protein